MDGHSEEEAGVLLNEELMAVTTCVDTSSIDVAVPDGVVVIVLQLQQRHQSHKKIRNLNFQSDKFFCNGLWV